MSITLTATTHTLRATTETANRLELAISYADITTSTTAGAQQITAITASDSVTVLSAPASSTTRGVKFLSAYNNGTGSNAVTFAFMVGASAYDMMRVELESSSSITWTEGAGWKKFNSYGSPTLSGLGAPADVQVFTATATWQAPYTFKPTFIRAMLWGAGGGGGGGCSDNSGIKNGGTGGGGGAYHDVIFLAKDFGASAQVAVGTGGAGGAGGTNGAAGSDGAAGGSTNFAGVLYAYGGGGGAGGSLTALAQAGGSGGGWINVGKTAASGDALSTGDRNNSSVGGFGAGAIAGQTGNSAEFGGASGGGVTATGTTAAGGVSLYGGCGGGAGGGSSATTTLTQPSAGGWYNAYVPAETGNGGEAGLSAPAPSDGREGQAGVGSRGGGGGGGGGSAVTATATNAVAGRGGDGGARGGGGGGGGAAFTPETGGAGGDGGRGEAIIISW